MNRQIKNHPRTTTQRNPQGADLDMLGIAPLKPCTGRKASEAVADDVLARMRGEHR